MNKMEVIEKLVIELALVAIKAESTSQRHQTEIDKLLGELQYSTEPAVDAGLNGGAK